MPQKKSLSGAYAELAMGAHIDSSDGISHVIFPHSINPRAAAWLLYKTNAIVIVPVNSPVYTTDYFSKDYHFIVKTNAYNDFTANPIRGDEKGFIDFCENMLSGTEKITIQESSLKKSRDFWDTHRKLIIRPKTSLEQTPEKRDYVNFLYSWAENNIRTNEITDSQRRTEAIFREYLFLLIKDIEATKSESEKMSKINKIIETVIFDDSGMVYKINQFNNCLGRIKNSVPPALPIVLEDGTQTDVFKLDGTKHYRIMHQIDVSKNKIPFDFSNIDINSNFICSGAREKIVFPKSIRGCLDCSNTKLDLFKGDIPNGTTKIDFSRTVKNFSELLNMKFPKSVREILLSRSMLNATAKDLQMLRDFRQFQDKNPHIEIWDSKHALSLQDILVAALNQIEQKRAQQNVAAPVAAVKITDPTTKTEQWLSRKEIVELCRADARFKDIDADMEKLVRLAIKTNNQIKSGTKSHNGQSITCVHMESLDLLKQVMLQIYKTDAVRETPKPTTTSTPKPQAEKKVAKVKKEEKQTIKIEKYIPKQIWKSICNACGDSLNLLYSVLERINKVNINYATLTPHTPLQYLDKNKTKQIIPNTEVKSGCAASQHIENNDNRRIVWTINPDDKIMVAIAFFADHVNNAQAMKMYNSVAIPNAAKGQNMDGITITKDFVERSDYLNVSELLETYAKKIADKQKNNIATNQSREKRPRIMRPASQTHTTMVDVKSLEVQIENFISNLDAQIKRLAKDVMNNPDDTQRQLRNVEEMQKLLQEKMSLQQNR